MPNPVIAGVDEAGRGALAGPVVAVACVCSLREWKLFRSDIADSKMLSTQEREEGYTHFTAHCAYGLGIVGGDVIDREGILTATERAMQEAVAALGRSTPPTYLLIDGRDKFWFDLPHSSIIRGDQKESCIAAASIIAKVTRDRLMEDAEKAFPGYGFANHKGYGTPLHFQTLSQRGPCLLHRKSFLGRLSAIETPSGAFSR